MHGRRAPDGSFGRIEGKSFRDGLSRRLWRLESQRLCEEARRRTGLKDFGEPPLEPALSILADSLEAQAELHPLGRFLMRLHLGGLLKTRLRLAEAWRGQAKALEASPIPRPLFITGMPRSGSTFLHELLAEDPQNRAPRLWEVLYPVPVPQPQPNHYETRIWKAAASLWWFRRLASGADSVYPMRARTPQECVAIHSYTFLSEEFISSCRIPAYEAFLRATDLRPAYAWEKRFLQYLQLPGPAKRWILKSPDHVYGLEALFAVFPEAVILQTHRNPLEALRSSIQLTEVLQNLFARPAPRDQLWSRETQVLAHAMDRFIQFRDAHPELAGRFVDVKYSDLVSEPLRVIRRLYQQLDMPLTEVAAERIGHLAASRLRYPKQHRRPRLAELGLDLAAEARRFERYCFRFGIPCRPTEPS